MFERYIIIDVEQMISDYDDNLTSYEAVKEQYQEIEDKDIGSIDYSKDRVQTSPSNDGMINQVIRKEDIERKLKEYATFFKVYDPAWAKLTKEEKFVLMAFCTHEKKQNAVDRICDEYGVESRKAYYLAAAARERFKRLMFG